MDSRASNQKKERIMEQERMSRNVQSQAIPVKESSLQLLFKIIILFHKLYEYLKQLFCQTFPSQFWQHLQQQDYNECFQTFKAQKIQDLMLKTKKQSGSRKLHIILCFYSKNQYEMTIQLIDYYQKLNSLKQIQIENQMQLIRLICCYMSGNIQTYTSQEFQSDMNPLQNLITKNKNDQPFEKSGVLKGLMYYRQILTKNKQNFNKNKINEIPEKYILSLERFLSFKAYTKSQIRKQIISQLIPTKWFEKIINYAKSKNKTKQVFPPPLTYFEVAFIDISKQNEQVLHIFKESKFIRIPKEKIDFLLACFQGIPLSQLIQPVSQNRMAENRVEDISVKKELPPQIQLKRKHQQRKGQSENSGFGTKYFHQQLMPRGLLNLGNTCYMNSGLQCLHKTKPLSRYIKQLDIFQHQSFDQQYLRKYQQLIEQLDLKNPAPFKPKAMKQLIGEKNFLFEGYDQHDSCELVSSVINNLHQALNTVVKRQIIPIDKTQKNQKRLYENYKKRDQMRMRSIIDDIFIGRFRTSYQCRKCTEELVLFEKFNVIYLPIPTVPYRQYNQSTFTLQDCMREFQKIDVMEGSSSWHCNRCNSKQTTDRKMRVYTTNKILIFCFKRFDQNRKIDPMIEYPLELDLGSLSSKNKEIQDKRYSLYGVINHIGSLHSGHYKAYCREQKDNWFELNDSHTYPIKKAQVQSRNAYVLFYELLEQ